MQRNSVRVKLVLDKIGLVLRAMLFEASASLAVPLLQ